MKAFLTECDRTGIPIIHSSNGSNGCNGCNGSTVRLGSRTSMNPSSTQATLHRLKSLCDNPHYTVTLDYEINDHDVVHVFQFTPLSPHKTLLSTSNNDPQFFSSQHLNKDLKSVVIGESLYLPIIHIYIPVWSIKKNHHDEQPSSFAIPIESIVEHTTMSTTSSTTAMTLSATTNTIFSINEGSTVALSNAHATLLLQLLKHRSQSNIYRIKVSIGNGFYYRLSFFSQEVDIPNYVVTIPIRSNELASK